MKSQLPWNLDTKASIHQMDEVMATERNKSKICGFTRWKYISLKPHVQWGQLGVLLIVVIHRPWQMDVSSWHLFSQLPTQKKGGLVTKHFYAEVTCISFAHIGLARASHLATCKSKMVEECNLLCTYSRRIKPLWTAQWPWTLIITTEGHALADEHHWHSVYTKWIIKPTIHRAPTIG